ncbi:MAG: MG2 domain-containing protein [Bacteroidales bacterium]|nr:MG2 domain-containing protein [Bacteroidales bacterium]
MNNKLLSFVLPFLLFFAVNEYINHSNINLNNKIIEMTPPNYEELWKKVVDFEHKGLPKSALEVVEQIYKLAKNEDNGDQIIKAIIHKMKYKDKFEDSKFETNFAEILKEAEGAKFPLNCVLYSFAADLINQYTDENYYQFMSRSETTDFDNNDMKTWSIQKLNSEFLKYTFKSIENKEELAKIKYDYYPSIILKGSKPEGCRPSLYDYLAYHAFENVKSMKTTMPETYFFADDFYFDIEKFANTDLQEGDSLSVNYNSLKILQDLAKIRISETEKNEEALVDFILQYLDFVSNKSANANKDNLLLCALENLENKYSNSKYKSGISYTLAKFYYDKVENVKSFGEGNKQYRKIAHDICQKIVDDNPNSEYGISAYNLIQKIEEKSITATFESIVVPNNNFIGLIDYQNLSEIYFKIIKIDYDKYISINEEPESYDQKFQKYLKTGKIVNEFSKQIPDNHDYINHKVEIVFPKQDIGFYLIAISDNANFADKTIIKVCPITISNLSINFQQKDNGNQICYVSSRIEGNPIESANIKLYYQEYSKLRRKWVWSKILDVKTNKEGIVEFPKPKSDQNSYEVVVGKNNDTLRAGELYMYNISKPEAHEQVYMFTDRAIYRPGQTIYFKGYAMNFDENNVATPICDKNYTVILRDVNNKEISYVKLVSNEYGTFNGQFEIPTGLLNGNMTIMTNRSYYKSVKVEEYKRPTFEVELNRIEGTYVTNDDVIVKGNAKSYSGMTVNNAEVKFRVTRTPKFDFGRHFYFFRPSQNPIEIVHGTVVTNEKGDFEFKFKAEPDPMAGTTPDVAFNYSASVEITDVNGETHQASRNVTIGFSSMDLNVYTNSFFTKSNDFVVDISARNLDFVPINTKGVAKISKVIDNGLLINRKWQNPDTNIYTIEEWKSLVPGFVYGKSYFDEKYSIDKVVLTKDFDTEKENKITIPEVKNFESGYYQIEVASNDPKTGREIKSKSYFSVCNQTDKKLPNSDYLVVERLNNNLKVGEKAQFLVGTSLNNQSILYRIYQANTLISSKIITLDNEMKMFEIPIENNKEGNIRAILYFVNHNTYFEKNAVFSIPNYDKDLSIEYLTFRDKLQPGENETWKLKVTDHDGKNVSAEVAATMYDKSLDAFAKNNYDVSVPYSYNYYNLTSSTPTFGTQAANYISNYIVDRRFFKSQYGSLNWFGYRYSNYRNNYRMAGMAMEVMEMEDCCEMVPASNAKMSMGMAKKSMAMEMPMASMANMSAQNTEVKDEEENPTEEVQVRTNFNETAFFYPELRTDENGELNIEFTMPESLTSWRMMAIAHTKQLQFAFSEKEIVTQKQLMVQPNAPRFFRENDKIFIPVKIGNLSETDLDGKITIEIFDPLTEKKVDNVVKVSEQNFSVKKGLSTSVDFELEIPERYSTLAYKIIAKSGNFADGEQKALPIMSNRMLVTEALPLPINANQTKNYKFEKLINSANSSTLRQHKLTLEFTSNPAWYAVQALPYMMEYPYECNEQTFSRLYANSIAAHIANSSPKIKAVFDAWKNSDSKALLSNLEKNEELKSVLLQETPWVMEGANETERKQRVGLLFDLNKIAGEERKTLEKLRKNQYPSGGWPWFDKMPESNYVTLYIVEGMGHLKKLGINTFNEPKNHNMLEKAINFIDDEFVKYYKELKKVYSDKELKEGNFLTFTAINYLYARSYFTEIPISSKTKEAFNFFIGKAEKYWLKTGKYSQAMISMFLHRYGNKTVPNDILKSLKEHSTSSEEMGMYFADNVSGFLWHEAPIETQSIIIEAFDEVANDQEIVDQLKIWLLKQKQTTDWKTTKATAEACYALLLRGTDLLSNSEICTILLNNQPVDPKSNPDIKADAGTGYFKTSWSGNEVKPEMGNVTVTNPNNGVAWGALYWQYFEQLDKITFAETPLKISKKLFRENITDKGVVIEPVTENSNLKPGDKIVVRIEIRTDRDMEYVHLKDMRASGFEPVNVLSGYRYQGGIGYYECTKDASTNFFIEYLRKGTYVFEYKLYVQHKGNFSNGITSIQCMYAPEFTAHSEGVRVEVK